MKVLVVGASGATGRHLVDQLLSLTCHVKAVVRNPSSLPDYDHPERLQVNQASILELRDEEMEELVMDCDAITCCLGHNPTMKGLFGKPRRLVTEAVRRLSNAVIKQRPSIPVKFVLMNTVVNQNRDLNEIISDRQKVIVKLLRKFLPPHPDNEEAADHLRVQIGQENQWIEWCAVRPDTLVDEKDVTSYELHPSPIRDPFFNAGKTSRINVANFMARLVHEDLLWKYWKGKMPVIYNKESE